MKNHPMRWRVLSLVVAVFAALSLTFAPVSAPNFTLAPAPVFADDDEAACPCFDEDVLAATAFEAASCPLIAPELPVPDGTNIFTFRFNTQALQTGFTILDVSAGVSHDRRAVCSYRNPDLDITIVIGHLLENQYMECQELLLDRAQELGLCP